MKLFGSFTREKNGIAVRSPDLTRRGLIVGAAASLIAAPAIVRVASLMPVKAYEHWTVIPNPFGTIADDLTEESLLREMKRWRDELFPGLVELRQQYLIQPALG